MLDNQQCFKMGLCSWIGRMWNCELITENEYHTLLFYIRDNRPSKFSSIWAFKSRHEAFYWKYGDIKPRVKWLKKQINSL